MVKRTQIIYPMRTADNSILIPISIKTELFMDKNNIPSGACNSRHFFSKSISLLWGNHQTTDIIDAGNKVCHDQTLLSKFYSFIHLNIIFIYLHIFIIYPALFQSHTLTCACTWRVHTHTYTFLPKIQSVVE